MRSSPEPLERRLPRRSSRLGWIAGGCICLLTATITPVSAQSDPDPAPSLARALAAHAAGDVEEALELLAPLAAGPLAAQVGVLQGRWLASLERTSDARNALEAALQGPRPADVRARIWRERAQVELAAGDLGAARQAQEKAWDATTDPAVASALAFELGQVFEQRGLAGEALSIYRTVWERWPASLEAPGAFARAGQLERQTGADRPEVGRLLAHLTALRRLGRCGNALEILPDVLSRPDKSEAQERALREERAACLFGTRQYTDAAGSYSALAEELEGEAQVEARIQAARARARAGQVKQGVRELSDIARDAPEPQATRARYLVAVLIDQDDARSARRLLQLVAEQDQDTDLARLAGWRLAWEALERNAHKTALQHLEPLTRGPWGDIEVQRARYWHAVVLETRDAGASRTEMTAIVDNIPLSYYGMLAADRLGLEPDLVRSVIEPPRTPASRPQALERALWLQRAGLPELAIDEARSWRLQPSLSREERMAGAALLHELGEHFEATVLVVDGFGDALEQGIDPEWRAAWTAAWPRPFVDTVSEAVREFEFDAALVYAIMREESRFRPLVQSAAGARGLMQLVTPTAQRIAKSLGVDPFEPENLYDPEVNVRFGTYYLKKLTEQFQGSRQLAVAAYNAGPEVVSTWEARAGAEPLDRFVDSVPYDETRRYLRRVLRSYRVYRALYPPEAPAPEAAGPRARPALNRTSSRTDPGVHGQGVPVHAADDRRAGHARRAQLPA